MKPEVNKYIFDMLESIAAIERYMASVPDLATFIRDEKTFDAVCRRFAIIGEALSKADKLDSALGISHKPRIIGLRHILVHDYDIADPQTIWSVYKVNLDTLKSELKIILS